GTLTVTGVFGWNSGTLGGTGNTIIASRARLDIQGPTNSIHVLGRPVDSTAGPMNWLAGTVRGTLSNLAGGLLNIVSGGTRVLDGTLDNAGQVMCDTDVSITLGSRISNRAGADFQIRSDIGFSIAGQSGT